jgi:hypothetical protein
MMEVLRRFNSEAPQARMFSQDKPTLLVCWWCTCYAISVILFRIVGRYVRAEKMFLDDRLMFLSIIPLLGRLAFLHVVLVFGTNNAITDGLSDENLNRRRIGSGLLIWAKVMEVT